ncbi:fructosamine kinase family protein [Longibacter salinarum]|nr:fructosamine kinase family protein [Longibacter salinarum]
MLMIPDSLRDHLATQLDTSIEGCAAVSGGCIANGCRLETGQGSYFLKWGEENVARTFPGEAAGLDALRRAAESISVPDVVETEPPSDQRPGFLLLQWINAGRQGRRFWETFGRGLAEMHRSTEKQYGFDRSNYIGRLPQENDWEHDWITFFRKHRLEPQVERARADDRWEAEWDEYLDALFLNLSDLLPAQPPASILHGDLWKGNFMVTATGEPAVIDPATYYGHREADLAMTELFGGFDTRFYDAYNEAWPVEDGYETRRDVYNLYHLINHLNHFGESYAGSVRKTLSALATV